jgi:hypothetical protein
VDAAVSCVRRDRRAGRKTCERSTARGREMLQRTAKSCGPDTPTLVSSLRSCVGPTGLRQNLIRETTVAKEPGHRGARYKPLRPLRAGMPGDSGVLVVARVRSTTTIAHETAGAAGTRHSPRPPRGRKIFAKLGRIAPRGVKLCLDLASLRRAKQPRRCHSGAMRSIEPGISRFRVWSCGPSRNDGDELLRGAGHRARIRTTRRLAMTMPLFEN